jgi:hypothetical protein
MKDEGGRMNQEATIKQKSPDSSFRLHSFEDFTDYSDFREIFRFLLAVLVDL